MSFVFVQLHHVFIWSHTFELSSIYAFCLDELLGHICGSLYFLSLCAAQLRKFLTAVQLMAAAESGASMLDEKWDHLDSASMVKKYADLADEMLEHQALVEAPEIGRAMSFEQATNYALEIVEELLELEERHE